MNKKPAYVLRWLNSTGGVLDTIEADTMAVLQKQLALKLKSFEWLLDAGDTISIWEN